MNFLPLIVVGAILAFLVLLETRRYYGLKLEGKDSVPTKARFGRRLLAAGLLFLGTLMVTAGLEYRAEFSPSGLVTYFLICLIPLLALFVVMVIDVRSVFRQSLSEFTDDKAEERRFKEFLEREARKELLDRARRQP